MAQPKLSIECMGDLQPKTTPIIAGGDNVDNCKERRQRRLDSRRRRMSLGGARRSSSSSSSGEDAVVNAAEVLEFGTMSVAGRMREMEDAVRVCTELCRPEIAGWRPVHFFAVYDGHGGAHVAALCKQRLHVFLQDELVPPVSAGDGGGDSSGDGQELRPVTSERENVEPEWKVAMRRTFEKMDEVALNTCVCGAAFNVCNCGYHPESLSLTGSTATVAIVTLRHIVVANCGDSRAVLYRRGRAIPLSADHKPDRPDELARVDAAGGRVIFMNGARVQGILAMSRAIGDKFLKPIVISEPEITVTKREPGDECLILASDGLWDVISNELACKVACQCLREGGHSPSSSTGNATSIEGDDAGPNSMYSSQSSLAAALLTRLALGRHSSDNISVIVVDLKRR